MANRTLDIDIDLTKTILKTERLVLRAAEEKDFDDFYAYASSDRLAMMIGWPSLKNKELAGQLFNRLLEGKRTFALIEPDEQKMIGNINLEHPLQAFAHAPSFQGLKGISMSFALSEKYQRQGLMTESLSAVITYVFEELHADFINCGYFFFNEASQKIQNKLGFKFYMGHMLSRYNMEILTIENLLYRNDWQNKA